MTKFERIKIGYTNWEKQNIEHHEILLKATYGIAIKKDKTRNVVQRIGAILGNRKPENALKMPPLFSSTSDVSIFSPADVSGAVFMVTIWLSLFEWCKYVSSIEVAVVFLSTQFRQIQDLASQANQMII